MAKVIERKPRGLRGFTFFKVGLDVYLKCNRCCRAWYRGQCPGHEFPTISKADRYNLKVHAERHSGPSRTLDAAASAAE